MKLTADQAEASPTKRFFVSMLTRDITPAAILPNAGRRKRLGLGRRNSRHSSRLSTRIEFADDGVEISVADINDDHLYVGYRCRGETDARVPNKRRPVLAERGLCKFPLFSLTGAIEVHPAVSPAGRGLKAKVSVCTQRTRI